MELDAASRHIQKSWMPDDNGPTLERLAHAREFLHKVGPKSRRHITMYDDALGRAWMRSKILDEEYTALKRYAYHWRAGGLGGALQSVDLNRILAFDPAAMSGLAKSEAQVDHREAYHAARVSIGKRPGFVADQVACYGSSLADVGLMLGYQSVAHGRAEARQILSDAGYRLCRFWRDRDRRS